MNCDICKESPATLCFKVQQKGHACCKARICFHCLDILNSVAHQYRGLEIEEISLQDFNEMQDKLWQGAS